MENGISETMSLDLSQELVQSKTYRDAFVDAHVTNGVAFQLRALRESRHWDQKDVARELGKPTAQPMISRYENPDYGKYAVSTLLEFAHLYDVALIVKYAPFSELIKQDSESQSESFDVPTFKEERAAGLIENNNQAYAGGLTTDWEAGAEILPMEQLHGVMLLASKTSSGTQVALEDREAA